MGRRSVGKTAVRRRWLLHTTGGRVLVLFVLFAVPVACFVPVAPQGWRPDRGPVVPHDTFPADCSLCHVTGDWHTLKEDFSFDHEKETGVALEGAHKNAECLLCHNDRGPAGMFASRGCGGCHEDPHRGKMGDTCDACHQSIDWAPVAPVARHAETRFPLIGAHAVVACYACHPGATVGNFERLETDCLNCHRDDYARADEPDHQALGWTDCADCHLPTAFSDVRFAHTEVFPLSGAHAALDCRECHTSGSFGGLDRDCASCHRTDYDRTTDPNHATAGFSLDCRECHNTMTFDRARFDHNGFPLTGAHRGLSCEKCHQGGVYSGTPSDCYSCHRADYDGTNDPNHAASNFSTDCTSCHSRTSWRPATFDHSRFPLTGAHKGVSCESCHQGGVYTGTPSNCVDCHTGDYNRTTDPNHLAAGFPLDCAACHGTTRWEGAQFNHQFPIDSGSHRRLSCADCHPNPARYSDFACTTCHEHSQSRMNSEHREVRNYVYSSPRCLQCHPRGREEDD
jgi:hypothetical protein